MSYKEISRREEVTVRTVVQFDFLSTPTDISHFMPADEDEIIANIATREASELAIIESLVQKADVATAAVDAIDITAESISAVRTLGKANA